MKPGMVHQNPFPTGEAAQNANLSSPTLFNNEVRFVNLRCISDNSRPYKQFLLNSWRLQYNCYDCHASMGGLGHKR